MIIENNTFTTQLTTNKNDILMNFQLENNFTLMYIRNKLSSYRYLIF